MTSKGIVHVVDDDEALRRAMARLLRTAGFETVAGEALSGRRVRKTEAAGASQYCSLACRVVSRARPLVRVPSGIVVLETKTLAGTSLRVDKAKLRARGSPAEIFVASSGESNELRIVMVVGADAAD
jgi:hypothetical protein